MRRYSLYLWGLLILLGLAACGGDDASPVVLPDSQPTRTLVPPTVTPTQVVITPTITPTDLPAPSTLAAASNTDTVPLVPAQAQVLIDRATDDLIMEQGVDAVDVRLLGLESFFWRAGVLGCDSPADDGNSEDIRGRGYRILFSTGSQVFVYHTDDDSTLVLCDDPNWLAREGQPLPLDPIAESMVAQTRRDAARRLDVDAGQVRLVSLLDVAWPDASVGCPQPDTDYADVETPGWRIVFRTDDQTLVYHTSIRHYVLCSPDEAILPGLLRAALADAQPTPTPEP